MQSRLDRTRKKACSACDKLEIETSSETILADLRQGMNNQTHWTSINRKLGKITPYIK